MEPERPEIVPTPAPAHFAAGDAAAGCDLNRRILACLRDRVPDLKGVHVTVFGSTAVLRGEVRTSEEKRVCVECCRHVPGVLKIVNDLTVADDSPIHFDPSED
ncbi:MAG TPA: BON domain-containing protein [Planctomycetaceae bacterium]